MGAREERSGSSAISISFLRFRRRSWSASDSSGRRRGERGRDERDFAFGSERSFLSDLWEVGDLSTPLSRERERLECLEPSMSFELWCLEE